MFGNRNKRQKRREKRKDARQVRRMERKSARRAARADRAKNRQSSRMFAVDARAGARTAAYNAGIDPRGWIADSVDSVSDAVGDIYGQPAAPALGAQKKNAGDGGEGSNVGMLAAAAAAALLLMK